ncbi:MAG: hypothetical protein HY961_18195 [Ignavibacteriae bacterium]|nr:hypothetical protein [Ignavibacteriota bacterium]
MPPFQEQYLNRGHAVHFRSHHPDASGMRIDIMSAMRGVDPFEQLWDRRTTVESSEQGESFAVISLPDLVKAKKTQCEKDWPMIRRLIEADYLAQADPSSDKIRFWLTESRTAEMLVELAESFPKEADALVHQRLLLSHALSKNARALGEALEEERAIEVENDRAYWKPLRKELEELRHQGLATEEPV